MAFMPWLLALFVLVGGAQQTENAASIVARYWAQYTDWTSHRDIESLANLFGEDARVMEPGIDDIVGRPAIRSLIIYVSAQRVRTVDVRMMPREVAGFDGVIYDHGNYVETRAPQNNPKQVVDIYGRYFAVWAQQPDGTWKIARLMRSPTKQPAR